VPLPETVAVPTVVPPVAQLVGAEDCGPKTLIVIVPVGLVPPARVLDTELAAMAVPAVPEAGPDAVTVGLALEMDSVWEAEASEPEAAVIFGLPA
jgi:hypothetical protein